VKAAGREIVEKGFAVLAKGGGQYPNTLSSGGGDLSAADAALFYVEYWAAKRLNMKLPTNVAAHYDRMMARPAVKRALQQEGLN
jgi:glutathione S-transferase